MGQNENQSPVVIVTGCTSGIGLHLAGVFAARGFRLVATARRIDALKEIAAEQGWDASRVVCRKLEVTDPENWRAVFDFTLEKWGRVDILINNAGYSRPGFVHRLDPAEIDRHVEPNLKGPLLGCHLAAKQMVAQGSGHIINVASLAGIAPVPGICLYSATKFALRGFSLGIAMNLRELGVYVTVICMDVVDTPFIKDEYEMEESALSFSGGRVLKVEEIETAVFRALKKKPVEIMVPSSRGWLSKLGNVFPGLGVRLYPALYKKGRARQARELEKRQSTQI